VAVSRAGARTSGWPVGSPPPDYEVGHVRAVLPDGTLDDARVVVRDGRLAEVGPHPPGSGADLDGRGAFCLPGLIDVHSDVLSRECRPRPGAAIPVDLAVASVTPRLRAAGITTAYHGVAFQARSAVGVPIGSPSADDLYDTLGDVWSGSQTDAILHRLDVRCPDGVDALGRRLARIPPSMTPIVSHEDHTPGQGQYADPATMRRWMVEGEGMSDVEAAEHVDWWRSSRAERHDLRERTLAWLGELATAGRIRLFGHDPETTDDVAALVARGGRVAEFPTTVAAARAARTAGLRVVAGAPNVIRGGSHTGNVSATELVAGGLVDALASDYLPTAMLSAAITLVRRGLRTLPGAVALVTSGPADAVGLDDRGSLVAGQRADLVLADLDGGWPVVLATLVA
jgi:alpha-D-ribose 1-methylphosphonate 5-triphosphate diphosphatase